MESAEPYQFKTMLGNPIPEWANQFLNTRVEPENRQEFDRLVHEVERFFENWNREVCPECGKENTPAVKWGYGGVHSGFKYSHGCCAGCRGSAGYFTGAVAIGGSTVDQIFKPNCGFDDRFGDPYGHGFFNEAIGGCSIPRHLRSETCLRFCCDIKMAGVIEPIVTRICEIRGYR